MVRNEIDEAVIYTRKH